MIKRRGCNEDKEKLRREAETGTIVEVNTGILNLHLHVSSQVVKKIMKIMDVFLNEALLVLLGKEQMTTFK